MDGSTKRVSYWTLAELCASGDNNFIISVLISSIILCQNAAQKSWKNFSCVRETRSWSLQLDMSSLVQCKVEEITVQKCQEVLQEIWPAIAE